MSETKLDQIRRNAYLVPSALDSSTYGVGGHVGNDLREALNGIEK